MARHRIVLTDRQVEALCEACGFRMAGEMDGRSENQIEALKGAHNRLSLYLTADVEVRAAREFAKVEAKLARGEAE